MDEQKKHIYDLISKINNPKALSFIIKIIEELFL